ncbi:SET domain-containing protein [Halobacteriovorax sp. JY17]|uniref:SET domain-containing protein-lysine N-methyltransferase n=1 Tax=Halobacteriovorax sp. JY17 TaxID=2014617 RepID=UPI000C5AE4BF|nr:SET domain-containing protein [Halobacteriovorax sp. JY17]PIK16383.1 MAG: SET domain-containing protein-lysine N-methyltransferase [Halobacteriovorax sp. JY17]
MLLVKTFIKESPIHGKGLFADEDISEGTPIWKYSADTTSLIAAYDFINLCKQLSFKEILTYLTYSYLRNDQVWHVLDNSKYINHGENSNIAFLDNFQEIAIRDIKKGEELIENYHNCYDHNDFFNWDFCNIETKENALELLYKNWKVPHYA